MPISLPMWEINTPDARAGHLQHEVCRTFAGGPFMDDPINGCRIDSNTILEYRLSLTQPLKLAQG